LILLSAYQININTFEGRPLDEDIINADRNEHEVNEHEANG
jgi:hypothetical protein